MIRKIIAWLNKIFNQSKRHSPEETSAYTSTRKKYFITKPRIPIAKPVSSRSTKYKFFSNLTSKKQSNPADEEDDGGSGGLQQKQFKYSAKQQLSLSFRDTVHSAAGKKLLFKLRPNRQKSSSSKGAAAFQKANQDSTDRTLLARIQQRFAAIFYPYSFESFALDSFLDAHCLETSGFNLKYSNPSSLDIFCRNNSARSTIDYPTHLLSGPYDSMVVHINQAALRGSQLQGSNLPVPYDYLGTPHLVNFVPRPNILNKGGQMAHAVNSLNFIQTSQATTSSQNETKTLSARRPSLTPYHVAK